MREMIERAVEYLRDDPGFVAVGLWLLQLAAWAAWRLRPTARALFPLTRAVVRRGGYVAALLGLPALAIDLATSPIGMLLGIRRRKPPLGEDHAGWRAQLLERDRALHALTGAFDTLRARVGEIEKSAGTRMAAGQYVVWARTSEERMAALEKRVAVLDIGAGKLSDAVSEKIGALETRAVDREARADTVMGIVRDPARKDYPEAEIKTR